MDDAAKMNEDLLDLVAGRVARHGEWPTEVPNDYHFPGSRNKPLTCKAAEGFDAFRRHKLDQVQRSLDWWPGYFETPFMQGEEFTGEEVYASMFVYPPYAVAALARKVGRLDVADACLSYVRAQCTWLGIGAGTGPGKIVTDHLLNNVSQPVVLVGNGGFRTNLRYVARAGMRGLIRNRDGGPQTFHFTESIGLSVILHQALGLSTKRSYTPWQYDLFAAINTFTPDLDIMGFSSAQRTQLLALVNNPTNLGLLTEVVKWVKDYAPPMDFEFIRYVNGAVYVYMLKNHSSSTDDVMISAWLPNGTTYHASADDGLRSSHLPMTCHETPTTIVCEGGGRRAVVVKPTIAESHRVSVRSGVVSVSAPGVIVVPPVVPLPTAPNPSIPSTQKESKWRFT